MEPITNPVSGKTYFGYHCRCGEIIYTAPEQDAAELYQGTEPIPCTCCHCHQASSVASKDWKRYVAP